jgi:cell division protein ZapA
MKQLEVQIMGQSYLLGCPDGGEARLLEAAHQVDQAMCKIRDAGKVRARDRIAVLAALNLAFDLGETLRQTTLAAAATLPAAQLASTTAAVAPTGEAPEKQAQVQGLLSRLDAALSEDGRLI